MDTYGKVSFKQLLNLMKPLADKKNISLSFKGTEVLLNLLSNALKHTEQGAISISVETAEGSHILTICDTGCGIAAEHLDSIFTRFYKVDSSRGQQSRDNGLGLAI